MIKIFVTVGSQQFQFNRLLKELNKLDNSKYEIFAQIGNSSYMPTNYAYTPFLNPQEFKNHINKADLIITHAGTGAIMNSLKLNKPIIAVARLAKYHEHVDNHQLEIVRLFQQKNYIIGLEEVDNLDKIINECLCHKFETFESNTKVFMDNLKKLID